MCNQHVDQCLTTFPPSLHNTETEEKTSSKIGKVGTSKLRISSRNYVILICILCVLIEPMDWQEP